MTDNLEIHMKVIDAAENMLVAYGMGWDMEGTIEAFDESLREFQNAAHTLSRSDDVKSCEQVIKSATAMRLGLRCKFSREQIDGDAKNLGRAIMAVEPLRAQENSPASPG